MVAFSPLPAAPNDRPARIRVRLNDGKELVSECLSAQGGPDRPFPEDVLIAKIRELSAPAYPKLLPVLMKIAALEPSSLERGWRDTVDEFAA